jgi:hypothetical protein
MRNFRELGLGFRQEKWKYLMDVKMVYNLDIKK